MASKIQRELAFLLTGKDVSASKAMRGVRKEINELGRISGKAAGNISRNIQRAVVVGGAAAVGAIGYAVKAAMDFESATAGVAKTVDGDITAIVEGLKEMSSRAPIAYEELAAIAEAGGALGVAKGDILGFTDVVAKLGVTTDLTSEAAATALGHLTTTLRLSGPDYEHFGNALVDLGNNGASTESQILGMAESMAGAAAIVDLSKDQLLGWAAALANTGEEVEAGGSSMQRFFLETFKMVNDGGTELKLLAKTAGMTAKDFKRAFDRDASGTLERFLVQLGKLDEGKQVKVLEDLGFTDIRITRALLKLLANTGNLTDSLDLSEKAWAENNAMTKEAEKRFATSASQMKILEDNVRLAAATIGAELLPQLNELAKDAVSWIQEHQPEIKQFGKDLAAGIREAVKWARSLDWDAIGGALKAGAGAAKGLVDAFLLMPDWAKNVLVGGFALNKFTGGLVTDLAGFIGKLAIQRMMINAALVNINAAAVKGGGLGAGAGVAGSGYTKGGLLKLGIASAIGGVILAELLTWVHENFVMPDLQKGAGTNITNVKDFAATGSTQDLMNNLQGLKEMPDKLNPLQRVLYDLNANGIRVHTESLVAELDAEVKRRQQADSVAHLGGAPGAFRPVDQATGDKTLAEIQNLSGVVDAARADQVLVARIADAQRRIDDSILRANTNAGFHAVVAAVRASRPIVNLQVPVYVRAGVTSRTVTEARYESDRYASVTTSSGMKAI